MGHWEGDLIKGKDNASAVGMLVELTCSYVIVLIKMNDATATVEGFSTEPNRKLLLLQNTMMYDQGKEMAHHAEIPQSTCVDIYFCDFHNTVLIDCFKTGVNAFFHSRTASFYRTFVD